MFAYDTGETLFRDGLLDAGKDGLDVLLGFFLFTVLDTYIGFTLWVFPLFSQVSFIEHRDQELRFAIRLLIAHDVHTGLFLTQLLNRLQVIIVGRIHDKLRTLGISRQHIRQNA